MNQQKNQSLSLILFHVVFWIVFFAFPFVLHPELLSINKFSPAIVFIYLVRYALWICVFYLNAGIWVPRFIYTKKYGQYILLQLAVMVALYVLHLFVLKLFSARPHVASSPVFFVISPYVIIWACSTTYQLISQKIIADKVAMEKERERLATELSFLRSQVSPHFMFNVLNNMVSLSRKNSSELESTLIKFSSLLRYMVYETSGDKKPLAKEVEYLSNFIDLQVQRFGAMVAVNANFPAIEKKYTIEPMLLIPFVENAFKHGILLDVAAQIDIDMRLEKETLYFYVKNRYDNSAIGDKDEIRGIGLTNVTRRLDLLYKEKYQLDIQQDETWFTVSLQLNLL